MHQTFFSTHSKWSDPALHRDALKREIVEPRALSKWIGQFMQHPRGPETAVQGFTAVQEGDLELRRVSEILSCASERNLLNTNSCGQKVGGVCRDFALIAVSAFRENSIPARLRVGFADYLIPGRWEDHWLCEWHDGHRWRLLDVEFAAIGHDEFDTTDVPSNRFILAAAAWSRLKTDPNFGPCCGVAALDLSGSWFVAGSMFRDMAALQKLELKPWDYWGLSEKLARSPAKLPCNTVRTLDDLSAALTGTDQAAAHISLPTAVMSFLHPEARKVALND